MKHRALNGHDPNPYGIARVGGVARVSVGGHVDNRALSLTVRLEVAVMAEQLEDEAHEEREGDR